MFHLSFNPIAPWWALLIGFALVVGLTLWAYYLRLKGTSGFGRWVALGLRMAAVLLCLLAALRPSAVILQKVKQLSSIVFLVDVSESMKITDEANGQSRFERAKGVLEKAQEAVKAKKLGPQLEVKTLRFAENTKEPSPGDPTEPVGRQTALGSALMDSLKALAGTRIVEIILLSDGASNAGQPPLRAAQRLASAQVPIVAVGFGNEAAGEGSRDVAIRDMECAPTVFVKNELQVRGTLRVRGYPNQPIDVELWSDDDTKKPVAKTRVRTSQGSEVVTLKDLKWIPETTGEKKLTLKVKPLRSELITSNNRMEAYVNVKKGGLNALFIQGSNFSWEPRFLTRALDPAGEIHVDFRGIRQPAEGDTGQLQDSFFAPGQYDVYILSDLPADYLTKNQQRLLVRDVVERGAGLIMLGGRSSFGPGGWGSSPVGEILPTDVHPGDRQIEPEAGLKVLPSRNGLDSYVMKIGANDVDSARLWAALPPITGANDLGKPKDPAFILAQSSDGHPLMVGMNLAKGRVLAFAGETWVWPRLSDETRDAHRKFWRQAILWLAHKEDQGENQVRVTLDRRRVPVNQKVELTATARDAKNEPISGAAIEATVEYVEDPKNPKRVETLDPLFPRGHEHHGTIFKTEAPGEYKVTVKAKRNGQVIGSDSARFMVFQDDRELENPAADLALLKQLAEMTGGKAMKPEELVGKHIRSLDASSITDAYKQREQRLWDNWPFFLLFTALLSVEWWLRKRIGWV